LGKTSKMPMVFVLACLELEVRGGKSSLLFWRPRGIKEAKRRSVQSQKENRAIPRRKIFTKGGHRTELRNFYKWGV